MKITFFLSLIASTVLTFAQTTPEEATFQNNFMKAAKAGDTAAILALTCLDDVTPEWKSKIEGNCKFPEFQKEDPENISFKPYTEPQPAPIKYKDTFLTPNLPITTICEFTWPKKDSKEFQTTSTGLKLGKKNGKLLIICLIPQKKTEQGAAANP